MREWPGSSYLDDCGVGVKVSQGPEDDPAVIQVRESLLASKLPAELDKAVLRENTVQRRGVFSETQERHNCVKVLAGVVIRVRA